MQILQWCKRCGSFQHSFIHSFVHSFIHSAVCYRLPDGFSQLKNLTSLSLNDVSLIRLPPDIGRWVCFTLSLRQSVASLSLIHLDAPKNYTPTVKFYFWATSGLMTSVCPEFRHRLQMATLLHFLYNRIIIVVWVKVLDSGLAVFTGSCNSKQIQQVRFTLVHIPERFVKMFGM